jgi:hypothetical protein
MRLEIDLVEGPPDDVGADGRDDDVEDGLAGQVLTRPVGDVLALGHGRQAGELDDLDPLLANSRPGRSRALIDLVAESWSWTSPLG